jgi:hypothetical protein
MAVFFFAALEDGSGIIFLLNAPRSFIGVPDGVLQPT